MSREIKFRAYHFGADYSVRAEMIYDNKLGDVLNWKQQGQDLSDVMQYTGLKDKNGTEIFEKDIYETPNQARFVVEFSQNHNGYVANWINRSYGIQNLFFTDGIIKGEIIGNTFENPELLETKS